MDLYVTFCALYLLHCIAWVPGGACLLVATILGPAIAPGPGLRLLHPRPSARSSVGRRFPLEWRDGGLWTRAGSGWRAGVGEPVDLADLCGAEAQGTQVCVAGQCVARGAGASHAEQLAGALRQIGAAGPAAARQRLEAAIAEGLSLAALAAEQSRLRSSTRLLAWISDAYWLSLLAVAPAVVWWLGAAYSLPRLAAGLGALHVATLACYAIAHARLFPALRAERFEFLFGAAIYPPSALRAHHHLCDGALGGFHPAAIAALALPRDRARAFVRAEFARAVARASEEEGALRRLVVELGDSPASLLAEPVRFDPWALAYCPACACEYRCEAGYCADCSIPLVRWRPAVTDPA